METKVDWIENDVDRGKVEIIVCNLINQKDNIRQERDEAERRAEKWRNMFIGLAVTQGLSEHDISSKYGR